jgi:segregation and condensation protein A
MNETKAAGKLPSVDPVDTIPVVPVERAFIVDEATDEVLRLHLDNFEGPFEVLLYLIRSQEIDIFDIPIVKITDQYLRFLDLMHQESLEVVGDFLVMAATLVQIKSKMLLPLDMDDEEEEIDEEDPRLELVGKLIEYRKYRDAAARLESLEQERENWFSRNVKPKIEAADDEGDDLVEVTLYDLIQAFKNVLRFIRDDLNYEVEREGASVDDKIAAIMDELEANASVSWGDLFRQCRHRVEMVCCFLAILELCRMGRVAAHQHRSCGDIRLFLKNTEEI